MRPRDSIRRFEITALERAWIGLFQDRDSGRAIPAAAILINENGWPKNLQAGNRNRLC